MKYLSLIGLLIYSTICFAEARISSKKAVIESVNVDEQSIVLNDRTYQLSDRLSVFNRDAYGVDRGVLKAGLLITYQSTDTGKINSIQILSVLPKNKHQE